MHDGPTEHGGVRIDFEAEGLLDGLHGEERAERLALLAYLAADGIPLEELRRATAENSLIFLPADLVIGGRPRYTRAEVAERTGLEPEFLRALGHAVGMPEPGPDERAYTDADVESTRMAGVARQAGISEQEIFDLTRVLGRGLSQAAELMREIVLRLVLEPGLSERELAERYASVSLQLGPMMGPLAGHLLTMQLRTMAESEAVGAAERSRGRLPGSHPIAVCFADLVGFTRLGEQVPADEVGRLAARLERLAADVVQAPVRLVKTIGDAAMLTAPEPDPLLDATLTLVAAADAEGGDFPQLRAGVAIGVALRRAGDWFGRPVNLASRITDIARPGSVLAAPEVREAVRGEYHWSFAGERRLKGIRDPVPLYRVRTRADRA
jgi:adenylate cyclase